jgi:hypothetical protein
MSDFESKYLNFQGTITECGVWETPPPEPTTPYDTVIRADQPWKINLKWKVSGLAVPVQAGEWHVDALAGPCHLSQRGLYHDYKTLASRG